MITQKWIWAALNARKNYHKQNSTISHLKLNRKGAYGILEKKTQGAKFHELDNLEPCISLDFTKLV